MLEKTAVMKFLENYQKSVFNSDPFKKFEIVQFTHLWLYGKLSPPQVFPLFVQRIFKIAGRASVVE